MATGPFTLSIYETDEGNFVPIKLQPETLAITFASAANAAGAGPVDPGWPSADVSRSKKAIGIHARSVSVKLTAPTDPDASPGIIRVPVPKVSVYAAIVKGAAVTTDIGTGIVVGKSAEVIV